MQKSLGRLLLLLALVGFAAEAQETGSEITADQTQAAEIDALERRSSSQDLAAVNEATAERVTSEELSAARDTLDPAVPTAVLSQDIRRRATGNGVMDEMELGRTEITGNQELPKMLYIVPWQKSDPGDLTGKPVNTLLDEVLAPIDRSEFMRQVDYYGDLYGEEEE